MNNMYNSTEIYTIRGDMCYDNKVMTNTALSERQHQQHVVDVTEHDRGLESTTSSRWCRSRLRVPLLANVLVVLIVSFLLAALEWGLIPQTKQGFYCKDPSLSFPYRGDTISVSALLVVSIFGPLIVIVVIEALREEYFSQIRCRNVWQWYKEYLVVFCIVLLVTEVGKVLFGEHRPHFLLSCVPDVASTCQDGVFVYEYECTNTNAEATRYFLVDTSRSFPSGHSSVSMFAAFYSAAVVHWRMPTRRTGQLLKPLLVTVCCLWGVIASLTRITDRRHHWWDVLAGMMLGIAGAFYALFVLHQNTRLEKAPRTSPSTVTLLDERNKDAASVAI